MKSLRHIFRGIIVATALSVVSSVWAQPTLTSFTPTTSQAGVPTNTPVVFNFSDPMNQTPPAFGLSWFALIGTTFQPLDNLMSYQWGVDGRSLTARCSGGFPSGAQIFWDINATEFTRFIDDSELDQDYSSGFFTAAASGGGGGGTGPATVSLSYHVSYDQFSAGAPTLATSNIYTFFADAQAPSTRNLTTATVTPPGGAVQAMFGIPFVGPTNFIFGVTSNSFPQLQASFPSGNYAFSLQASGSNQLITVNLPNAAFPSAPTISNYVAAQSIAPGATFTLLFNAGGIASDFVFVHVEDEQTAATIFESPDFGRPGAFTGTSNHVVIAAGLIQAGKSYGVTIERWVATTNLTAGYSSTSGYGTTTHSRLVSPAIIQLSNPVRSGGTFTLQAKVNAINLTYVLERTSDLTNWFSVNSTVITTTNLTPLIDSNPNNPFFYYRVRKQ